MIHNITNNPDNYRENIFIIMDIPSDSYRNDI